MQSFLRNYATRIAVFLALAALLLFIPASLTASVGLRVFLILLIVLLLGGGIFLLAWSSKGQHGRLHYFLYDRRRAHVRAREELDGESVQDAMGYYLRPFTENEAELWNEFPKPLRVQMEAEPQFRPLVMYRMLYHLSQCEDAQIYATFVGAPERVITYLCHWIGEGGDHEMADYIYHLRKSCREDTEHIVLFFKKNKRPFAQRALRYVERNFDAFFVPKSRLIK